MTDVPAFDMDDFNPALLARRTMNLVRSVARAAGEGHHHLTVIGIWGNRYREAVCFIDGPVPNEDDENEELLEAAGVLATTTMGANAMLAARTMRPDGAVTFMSWKVKDLMAQPATAEQSRIAYTLGEGGFDGTEPAVTFVDAPALV